MARFELNIYDNDDNIVKTYKAERVRYGVFMMALKLSDEIKDKDSGETMIAANEIVKALFCGLTDEELANADIGDVFSIYRQVMNLSGSLKTPKN